jgi:hypothetical protein
MKPPPASQPRLAELWGGPLDGTWVATDGDGRLLAMPTAEAMRAKSTYQATAQRNRDGARIFRWRPRGDQPPHGKA